MACGPVSNRFPQPSLRQFEAEDTRAAQLGRPHAASTDHRTQAASDLVNFGFAAILDRLI